MNYLIVFAHPNPKSFCKGIVDTIQKSAEEKGGSVRIRDLYQQGFNPVLSASDFVSLQSGNVPDEIKVEQEHIKWADLIIFVYPVWWTGLPAMLKGYVDRVFCNGFAYEYANEGPRGLLKGKKALLFSTTGASNQMYAESGMQAAIKQTTDTGIFNFCGIEEVGHTFFGEVPSTTDETRKEYLKGVEKIIKEI